MSERRAFGERLRRHREKQGVTLDQIRPRQRSPPPCSPASRRGTARAGPAACTTAPSSARYADAVRLNADDTAAEFAESHRLRTAGTGLAPGGCGASRSGLPFALRLKLEVDPEEMRRRAARRVILAALDVLVVAAVATIVAFASGLSYWTALAIFSIAYQVSARLLSGVSPTERARAPPARSRHARRAGLDRRRHGRRRWRHRRLTSPVARGICDEWRRRDRDRTSGNPGRHVRPTGSPYLLAAYMTEGAVARALSMATAAKNNNTRSKPNAAPTVRVISLNLQGNIGGSSNHYAASDRLRGTI